MSGKSPVKHVTVGLDMSLAATGFCVKAGSVIELETIKSSPKTAKDEMARVRLICDTVLEKIAAAGNVALVGIEDYFTPKGGGEVR